METVSLNCQVHPDLVPTVVLTSLRTKLDEAGLGHMILSSSDASGFGKWVMFQVDRSNRDQVKAFLAAQPELLSVHHLVTLEEMEAEQGAGLS